MTRVHQSDREAWLEARKPLITASDCAMLLCENYEKNEANRPAQRGKVIMAKAGLSDPWEGNETTDIASRLEIPVIDMARDILDIDIVPHGWLDVDAVEPRLGATSDAMWRIGDGSIPVNVKVSSCTPPELCKPRKDGSPSEAAFANGIPMYYRVQLQAEMAVHNASHAGLLVLHHDQANLRLRLYIEPRHDGVIARIRHEVARAWLEIEALRNGKISVEST
jgi:hypothetical protein